MSRPMFEDTIESSVNVRAPARVVWNEVTKVDIASFRHPLYFRALGIPKPLSANVVTAGVGGDRVAHFSNGRRFSQQITDWIPNARYAFTFCPDPGFRVGWLFDLNRGPFRLLSGAYRLEQYDSGIALTLTTCYQLSGPAGAILRLPVKTVLHLFQKYLLSGIRRNAELRAAGSKDDA
jgi:hypothetical protein